MFITKLTECHSMNYVTLRSVNLPPTVTSKINHIPIHIQQDATLNNLFYLETALHVSGGTTAHHQERKQLYLQHLAFCHTVTVTCRYRGRDGTGFSVLWAAYATHSTLKPRTHPLYAHTGQMSH